MIRVTVFRVDTNQPFIEDAELVTNPDGSVSFKTRDGQFAGQEPNAYGTRNNNGGIGAYQKATVSGNVVTFLTRDQDKPMVYTFGAGKSY